MQTRKPNRLKYYDFSNAGWYYVTICTKDHKACFGNVEQDKMILNRFGKAVDNMWLNIQVYYPFVELDEYIIMPTHVHGIIIIDYNVIRVEDESFHPLHRTNLSNVIKVLKLALQMV